MCPYTYNMFFMRRHSATKNDIVMTAMNILSYYFFNRQNIIGLVIVLVVSYSQDIPRFMQFAQISRNHSVYAPSQWESALNCKAVFHCLGPYTGWSLHFALCRALLLSRNARFRPYPAGYVLPILSSNESILKNTCKWNASTWPNHKKNA